MEGKRGREKGRKKWKERVGRKEIERKGKGRGSHEE